jgi:large subunit ribosomal protein L10
MAIIGQPAVVTGQKDIPAAAKVVKSFGAEFDRLKVHFGYLNNQRLKQADLRLRPILSIEVCAATARAVNAPTTAGHVVEHQPASWPVLQARGINASAAPAAEPAPVAVAAA